ncbi:MAG: hypothetical protein RLZZ15_4273 [Verrucomicrobiota bacterium]
MVDAGPVVGLFNRQDQWHRWSASVLTVLDEPLATTETVWAEICHLLSRERACLLAAITAVEMGRLRLIPVWDQAGVIAALLEKYPFMDAGDASPVVLSEKFPRAKTITTDARHFTPYRRFRNEPLPLIHP